MSLDRQTRALALTFLLLSGAISVIGLVAYRTQANHLTEVHLNDLEAIAQLKADAITEWLGERRANVVSASGNPTIANTVAEWRHSGRAEAKARLLGFLSNFRRAYDFESAELRDLDGRLLLGDGDIMPAMAQMPLLAKEALAAGTAVMVDLYFHPVDKSVRFGHLAPMYVMRSGRREPIALLFVGLRASSYLYPRIQQWPLPSATGETVLVRRDKDAILFLNALRLRPGVAFHMQRPVASPDLPAAVAVRAGQPITIVGHDYRGVAVLAAARPVPDTDWFLVAKMDKTEALADLNRLAATTGALVLLALAATLAVIATLWQRQRLLAAHDRAAYASALQASEERYRAVFERSRVPMLLIDPSDGAIVTANRSACDYYGYACDQLMRLAITDLNILSPAEVAAEMALAEQEQRSEFFFRHRLANGEVRDVEVHSGPLIIGDKQLLYSIVIDVSARKRMERELQALNRDFVTLLENTTDFVYFKDRDSRFRFCSQTLAKITGHASWRDMIGKHDLEVFPPDTAKIYYEEELPIFTEGRPLLDKVDPYYDEAGRPGWVSTNKWPIFDDDGKTVVGLAGISRDVTDRMRMEQELREMAATDPLTALPNRRQFLTRLEEQLGHIERRTSSGASVMMLDVDYFKRVNDQYGHAVGDACLRHVADQIKSCLRKNDTAGRVGGEEFAILLPGADASAAGISAERLRATIEEHPLVLDDGRTVDVTVSIGVAELALGDHSVDISLQRADMALYQAKGLGRNQVVIERAGSDTPLRPV